MQAELEDLCMAVLEPGTYKQVHDEVTNLWGTQQDGLAALNQKSEAGSRSAQEAALLERRASSASAGPSLASTQARQSFVDEAVLAALRIKGPRHKGRTVRMSITPAMMKAFRAATSAAAGARAPALAGATSSAVPQYASAFTSSFDGDNSIPSNPRTGRTLHTKKEYAEMKRAQQAVRAELNAQAESEYKAEKALPWLTSDQRQVCCCLTQDHL